MMPTKRPLGNGVAYTLADLNGTGFAGGHFVQGMRPWLLVQHGLIPLFSFAWRYIAIAGRRWRF
jgi:hypothetical protein